MNEKVDGSHSIMIVEDNPDSRALVVKILKARGYRIFEAMDGEEALLMVAKEKPDLMLMDISIPKLDGLEVTRRIRKKEGIKDIPIVALTAHAMQGDREKALAAGCDGYISKPISVRDLPNQIKKFIKVK